MSLDDDVLQEVKAYAASRDVSLGRAVSELVRKGLRAPVRTKLVDGFYVVDLPPDSPEISTEHLLKLEDDLD